MELESEQQQEQELEHKLAVAVATELVLEQHMVQVQVDHKELVMEPELERVDRLALLVLLQLDTVEVLDDRLDKEPVLVVE
jgi:hypothetical protein